MTTPVDRDRLRQRLRYIREQMDLLQPLAADAGLRAERMEDALSRGGIVRSLQTSVEAMIDIAYHLCAKRYAREPQSAADAFEILAQRGDLPRPFLPRVLRMVRFRNLVVHGYLQTNSQAVESIVASDLGDFAEWERIVYALAADGDRPTGERGGRPL